MNAVLNTTDLKSAVSKSIKCAGMINNVPITQMIGLVGKKDSNKLLLMTTDKTNDLIIKLNGEIDEDFNVVVQVDIFSKLISKLTSEKVTLTVENNTLLVNGNGTYKIPLPVDSDGVVSFPVLDFENLVSTKSSNTKLSFVKSVINTNKASVSRTFENPCLNGYYINNDFVISTDELNACFNKLNLLDDTVLLPVKALDLLSMTNYENIQYLRNGDRLVFYTDDLCLGTHELEGIDIYPIHALMSVYDNSNFKSNCKVSKFVLKSVLDRLSLFIEQYDKNAIELNFTQSGLQINTKKSTGIETISYISSENFEPFKVLINIETLKSQINSYPNEEIEIWYGLQNCIKLKSDNIEQIISLLEEI